MKYVSLVLFALLCCTLTIGCKKSSHEIIMGPIISTPGPVVTIKKVETFKRDDRDGDFYEDVFYVENKAKMPFTKAGYNAEEDIGVMSNLNYEDTVDGERIVVRRRNKNVTYELRTDWTVPSSIAMYSMKYTFIAKGE